jgi:hypothetical protein
VEALALTMPPYEGRERVWNPISLAFGDPGLAFVFGHLYRLFPQEGWDRVAHSYAQKASDALSRLAHIPLGLFDGLAGVAFSVRCLSLDGRRYRIALARLDQRLCELTRSYLSSLPSSGGVATHAYDLISGLTGIGRYLLQAARSTPDAEGVVQDLLRLLIK